MLRCSRLEADEGGAYLGRVVIVNPRVRDPSYLETVNELFGLKGERAYGHLVDLVAYDSVDKYLKAEFVSRRATKDAKLKHR